MLPRVADAQLARLRTVSYMTNDIPTHDHSSCTGCDYILEIDELVIVLREPRHTLYKRSKCAYPTFPKRLRDRRKIAVLCRNAKSYLEAVSE